MENIFEISMLLDFYGNLLTGRQYEVLDLHYNNDYSLAEIAQQFDISRQGVYDNVKRGKASLEEFESKLGLVGKFLAQKKKTEEVLNSISKLEFDSLSEKNKEIINSIKHGIENIIEEF